MKNLPLTWLIFVLPNLAFADVLTSSEISALETAIDVAGHLDQEPAGKCHGEESATNGQRDQDDCTASRFIRCEDYSPEKPTIRFSDGSEIRNLSHFTEPAPPSPAVVSAMKLELGKIDPSRLSEAGKEFLLKSLTSTSGAALLSWAGLNLEKVPAAQIKSLEAPIEFSTRLATDAAPRQVKLLDAVKILSETLTPSEINELNKLNRPAPPTLMDPIQIQKVQAAFDFAKNALKEVISKGRPDSRLTSEEKNLIHRLDLVTLNHPKTPRELPQSCLGPDPNASYSPGTDSITVCPSMGAYPFESLLRTLGHELGHSIDPCMVTSPVFRFASKNPMNPFEGMSKANVDKITASPESIGYLQLFPPGSNGQIYYSSFRADLIAGPDGLRRTPERTKMKLIDAGLFELVEPSFLEKDGFTQLSERYPFHALSSCLQEEKGGGFQLPTLISPDPTDGGAGPIPPECGKGTQIREAFSDHLGTRVWEKYLLEHPEIKASPDEKAKVLSLSANSYCMEKSHTIQTNDVEHPSEELRLNRIFFKNPEVRKLFGCKKIRPACF